MTTKATAKNAPAEDSTADDGDGLVAVTPTYTLPDNDGGTFAPGQVRRVDPSDPEIQRYLKAAAIVPVGDSQ